MRAAFVRWPHPMDRGSSLIETLVIGFVVMLVTLPVLLTVVRMAEASDRANAEARAVASWVARHGEIPHRDADGVLTVEVVDGVVHVSSAVRIDVVAVGGGRVGATITGHASAPISPYRSDR